MKRPLVAGNWKMNGTLAETRELLGALSLEIESLAGTPVEILVIPPFTALETAAAMLRAGRLPIALGGQDLHWETKGAYTGEISGGMLRELGCTFVLVGHSERRTHFGEQGAVLRSKLEAALRDGLIPILCVGERLEERESARTEQVLDAQLDETLFAISPSAAETVVVAYEPVWAIGTGRTATPQQAEEAHRHIRRRISGRLGNDVGGRMRILYGGSVTAANAAELLSRPGVDGALVGGASLKATEFAGIVRGGSLRGA